jgi:hypothetical protein
MQQLSDKIFEKQCIIVQMFSITFDFRIYFRLVVMTPNKIFNDLKFEF